MKAFATATFLLLAASSAVMAAPTNVEGSVGLDVAFGSHKNGYEGENKRSVGLDVAFGSHKDGYEGENKGSVGLDVAFGSHKNGYEGEA